jgi:phytoene dehydrogenase-like protein
LHSKEPQVAVVGSGPNGLAAALELQRSGARVQVFERAEVVGGCVRTEEITLPGFRHDLAASMLPLGYASPFLSQLPLKTFGLEWVEPEIPFAHTFGETGLAVLRDVKQTAELLGQDRTSYDRLMSSLVPNWSQLLPEVLGPHRGPFASREDASIRDESTQVGSRAGRCFTLQARLKRSRHQNVHPG